MTSGVTIGARTRRGEVRLPRRGGLLAPTLSEPDDHEIQQVPRSRMSFYETYEFFALDHPLTSAEMRALRRISTRAIITPTRFWNFYDWGGLKGDPRDILRRYFDLFVDTC